MSDGLYVGLMTGTSVDAIDIALCRISSEKFELLDAINVPFSDTTPARITALFESGDREIDQLGALDFDLAAELSNAVNTLLSKNTLEREQIQAIGCHGQTIRHRPSRHSSKSPFTLQIGDPNKLAVETGIKVAADFRRKDIALGGQGAPLAPAFHAFLAKNRTQPSAFLNIGGIANITVISNTVTGFDTGPGNALLDYWINKHLGQAFDNAGAWASSGRVIASLLKELLRHDYFQIPPPKSTGKEEFTPDWLEHSISNAQCSAAKPEDVQATLSALSSLTIAEALKPYHSIDSLFVCGGGARNAFLLSQIERDLPKVVLTDTSSLGVHPDWMEACAFAWLAYKRINLSPVDLCSVTGASKPAILGGIWEP